MLFTLIYERVLIFSVKLGQIKHILFYLGFIMIQKIIFSSLILTLIGCSSTTPPIKQATTQQAVSSSQTIKIKELNLPQSDGYHDYFQEWKGVPYRYGGTNKKGVDCSAFTQDAFRTLHQQSLPRTTEHQLSLGVRINLDNAKKGDLIFFKTSTKVRHVGIYVGSRQFMHASTSKGVIISSLDNPYWKNTYWQIRRVL